MSELWTSDTDQAAAAFLATQSTLALATVDAEGRAQVAPLFFVSDSALNLFWLSSISSRHSLNLAARPAVAATVYAETWTWQAIRGLQIEGNAWHVDHAGQRAAILDSYRRKFELTPQFDALIAASGVYCLQPGWIRWLDNSVSFGYRAERG
jgi:uncharacterized protein YhbP (UPF0306 family)